MFKLHHFLRRPAMQHTFINTLQVLNFCMQSLQRVFMLLLEEQNIFLQRCDACAVCICPGLNGCFWALDVHGWRSDPTVTGQKSGVSHPVQISNPGPAGQVSQGWQRWGGHGATGMNIRSLMEFRLMFFVIGNLAWDKDKYISISTAHCIAETSYAHFIAKICYISQLFFNVAAYYGSGFI